MNSNYTMSNLIEEIKCTPDNLNVFLESAVGRNVCIWGTGVAGRMIYKALKDRGINIVSFIDGKISTDYINLYGIRVISPDKIPMDCLVVVAADVRYGIDKYLDHKYDYCYLDPHLLANHYVGRKKDVISLYIENASVIEQVFSNLNDERSKITFRNVLIHQAVHCIHLLWDVYEPMQYFGNDLITSVKGSFVDCGAYTGDTLKSFLNYVDGDYCYYAFEPERNNYLELMNYVNNNHLTNVYLRNSGVWDKDGVLFFQNNDADDTLAWKLSNEKYCDNIGISVNRLDNVLGDKKIDYIKMDVEGAEINALMGANQIIEHQKPILGISAYHDLSHFWLVPKIMLDKNLDYRVAFRHHSWNMSDTVCYGI